MMTVCSDGHGEIAYDGDDCPLCETIEMLQDRDNDCTRAEERVGEVEAELADAFEEQMRLHARIVELANELEDSRATINDLNLELDRTLAESQRLLDMADRIH